MDFKPGDIVELKSGSVPMVVEYMSGGDAYCVLQEKQGGVQKITLNPVVLQKIEPNNSAATVYC